MANAAPNKATCFYMQAEAQMTCHLNAECTKASPQRYTANYCCLCPCQLTHCSINFDTSTLVLCAPYSMCSILNVLHTQLYIRGMVWSIVLWYSIYPILSIIPCHWCIHASWALQYFYIPERTIQCNYSTVESLFPTMSYTLVHYYLQLLIS